MVVIKCRIIAKPQEGTRPIYRKRNDEDGRIHKHISKLFHLLIFCGLLATIRLI